jgi:alpha-galactosidase
LNVLANPEVIDVDQDPLGQSAAIAKLTPDTFLLIKEMQDGSKAVGLFNQRETATELKADWSVLGARGPQKARDLWRQKDLGVYKGEFSTLVRPRGATLIRLWPSQRER